ncbi:retrotransposable element Tf2 [Tanacetum coccineum]
MGVVMVERSMALCSIGGVYVVRFMALGSIRGVLRYVSIMRMLRLKEVARKTAGMHLEFAPDYAFSDSLLLTPLCCEDIHDVTSRVSALAKVKNNYDQDSAEEEKIHQLTNGTYKGNEYTWDGFVLKRKGKIVVRNDELLKTTIIKHFHIDAVGGHSGTNVTSHRLEPYFTGNECIKGSKGSQGNVTYVSMDFIMGLPKSQGKTIIFVVVDRLSKYAHFMALSHPYTASSVAQVFLDFVYKLHGLPSSIISDRVVVFLSNFWQSLFRLLKVNLKMSITYHPQTDGQTEVVNKCLECSLRFMYGQAPPLHVPYVAGESDVEVVNKTLQAREIAIEMLKFYLKRAQDRMEMYADRKRSKREFKVDNQDRDLVLRRKKEKSLDYNNLFLGEYECSSLALDREERRDEKKRFEHLKQDQTMSKRVRSGNDFKCTYNHDKCLSEIQLEHWKEDGSRVMVVKVMHEKKH